MASEALGHDAGGRRSDIDGHADLVQLIGLIYDSVGDVGLWPTVLQKVSDHIGADVAIHATFDMSGAIVHRPDLAQGLLLVGGDAAQGTRYPELAPISPLIPHVMRTPVGGIVYDRFLIPRSDFERSVFFDQWVRPAGVCEGVISPLTAFGEATAVLTLMRTSSPCVKGFHEDGSLDDLRLILPHMARALKLNERLFKVQAKPDSAAAEGLDALATAVLCFDRNGRSLWCNAAAEDLLSRMDGLCTGSDGVIAAASRTGTAALERLVATTAAGVGGAITLERPSGRPALCLVSVPLSQQRAQGWRKAIGATAQAAGFLAIIEPDRSTAAGEVLVVRERLRALFGLTETEALVATSVAQHGGLPRAAAALNIAQTTVHTHLKRVFAKMGVQGQSALARRVEALGAFK